jgi:hypothetical protein
MAELPFLRDLVVLLLLSLASANPASEETPTPGDTLILLGTNPQVERALALLEAGPAAGR